jgi:hypothetical protein
MGSHKFRLAVLAKYIGMMRNTINFEGGFWLPFSI